MREKYWSMFQTLKYKELYYCLLQTRLQRIDGALSAISIVASSAGVAAWWGWGKYPEVWGTIIVVVQVIQLIRPSFKLNERLGTLRFLIPALSDVVEKIDRDWSYTHEMPNAKLRNLIYKYESAYSAAWKQFGGDSYFPISTVCAKKAKTETKQFFYQRYNVTEWSDFDEQ